MLFMWSDSGVQLSERRRRRRRREALSNEVGMMHGGVSVGGQRPQSPSPTVPMELLIPDCPCPQSWCW